MICNTAHFFADRLQKELSIPLLNMVRETARALRTVQISEKSALWPQTAR